MAIIMRYGNSKSGASEWITSRSEARRRSFVLEVVLEARLLVTSDLFPEMRSFSDRPTFNGLVG